MDLNRKAFFSRYCHAIENGTTTAFYHALGMRPLFVSRQTAEYLRQIPEYPTIAALAGEISDEQERADFEQAVEGMIQYKMLIPNTAFDDEVIRYFRDRIPEASVQVAFFVLTDACNFNCSYCFIEHDRQKNQFNAQHMDWESARQGLDFYCDLIARDPDRFNERKAIQFYGGEPLLRFDIIEKLLPLIEDYKKQNKLPADNLEITCITNGALLDEKMVRLFKKHDVGVTISLDGNEAANTNRVDHRGRPAYTSIRRGIDLCKKHDVTLALSITLSEESLRDEEAILQTIAEIKPDRVGFNTLVTGPHCKVSDDYHIRASDFVLRAFEYVRSTGVTYEDNFVRKVASFAEASVCVFDCGAVGGNQIIIMPDGRVGICEGFIGERKFITGDVHEKDFDPRTNPLYREWSQRMPLRMEVCQDCIALGICGGGCLVGCYKNEGSIWALNEKHCYHVRNATRWLIWDTFKQMRENGDSEIIKEK